MMESTSTKCQSGAEVKRSEILPRIVREKIIHQYLSGRKTYIMLAKEYNLRPDTMVRRFTKKNDAIFTQIVNQAEMSKKAYKDENQIALPMSALMEVRNRTTDY